MDDIASQFEDAGLEGIKWKDALRIILEENDLLDVDLKPSNDAEPYLPLFRKHHRRGLREHREEKRRREEFERLTSKGYLTQEEFEKLVGEGKKRGDQ